MVDVFISYSRRDQDKVAMLARAIADEGYDIWWDAELPPHRSYGDVITDKIAGAKAALVVWSVDSAQSEWVRAEADMARNQKKLIQTAIDDVMPPLPFNQIQYADIGDWRGEADHIGWRKVKVSLEELCGQRVQAEWAPKPAHRSQPEPLPSSVPAAESSRPVQWPLFVGIGVGALGIVVAAALMLPLRGGEPVPDSLALPAANKDGQEDTPDALFGLLATVADPDGYSNVRAARSASSQIIGRVLVGEAFATYDQTGDWWQVRLPDGKTGYIARSRIRLSGEPGAVAVPNGARPEDKPVGGGKALTANPDDMSFPDSSDRLLEVSELARLGPATLRVARNEIYARKGRRFKDPWLSDYFSQYSWYRPLHDEVELNPVERKNIATIKAAEARFQ